MSEAELRQLREEFEAELRPLREEKRRLDEDLRHWRFEAEVKEAQLQKVTEERDMLLQDNRRLALKKKKLKEELKGKRRHSSKKVKLSEEERKEMDELRKELEYWKKQAYENERKALEARRKWEVNIEKQSQEITELKIKLREETIKRVELQEENKSMQHVVYVLEQLLKDQEKFIITLQEAIYQFQ